jgi:hypothetical protein
VIVDQCKFLEIFNSVPLNPDVLPIISPDGYCENTTAFLCIFYTLLLVIFINNYTAAILQYLRGLTSGKLTSRPNLINSPVVEQLKEYVFIGF